VWVYLELPRHPYSFRDADDRLASAAPLHAALTEIGKWSIDGTGFGGVAETTARDRQVTLHSWRVEDPPGVPASATPRYARFLEEQINPALSSVPRPYAMIGVRAWPDADTDETPGLLGPIRELAARVVLPGRPFDIAPYRADIERIRRTVTQLIPGARVPSSDLMDLFTWWFAPRTREATPVVVTRDMVVVDEGLSLQFHALSSITDEGHHLNAATDAWVHYAMNYADPAVSVTVGFNLRGAATARRQARRGLRTLMRTVDEEAATEAAGGAGRPELEDRLRHVSDIEQHFATDSTAVPCDLTVIVASEAGAHPSVRPLPSELETTFGMRVPVLCPRAVRCATPNVAWRAHVDTQQSTRFRRRCHRRVRVARRCRPRQRRSVTTRTARDPKVRSSSGRQSRTGTQCGSTRPPRSI
jgi:hypothetical protein